MPDETEFIEDEDTVSPLEVKVIKEPTKPSVYDSTDDPEYDELVISDEQIKEFENGEDTPVKEK